jgi:thiosulfate/3-mercaptopyruvate sulfurtransferase
MVGVSPLIRPTALADLLADLPATDPEASRPVLLDVRWRLTGPPAYPDYLVGHLPDAVFVDLGTVLADPPGPAGRHPLPDTTRLVESLASAGVCDDSTVVVYDDADGSVAARAWWLLRLLGLAPAQVMVLDGGWAAWTAEGHPVSTTTPDPRRGNLSAGRAAEPSGMPVLDADQAADLARTGTLLDARAPARYRGDTEPVDPRAGHIPGALNAPFSEHLGPDGRWRDPAELAERFRGLGVDAEGAVGAYCGSGVTACSVVLAAEYAGLRDPRSPVALYAGSWSHWSADPARPVAVGASPDGAGGGG